MFCEAPLSRIHTWFGSSCITRNTNSEFDIMKTPKSIASAFVESEVFFLFRVSFLVAALFDVTFLVTVAAKHFLSIVSGVLSLLRFLLWVITFRAIFPLNFNCGQCVYCFFKIGQSAFFDVIRSRYLKYDFAYSVLSDDELNLCDRVPRIIITSDSSSPSSFNCLIIFSILVTCCATESFETILYSWNFVIRVSLLAALFCSWVEISFAHVSATVSHVTINIRVANIPLLTIGYT